MPDRAEQLVRASKARHEAATARALAALQTLNRQTTPVNFSQIAKTAGVSRSWLYRQDNIREQIERLRQTQPRTQPNKHPQRASSDSLRQQLHTYRDELARLRTENAALKDQLARHLGATRAASITNKS